MPHRRLTCLLAFAAFAMLAPARADDVETVKEKLFQAKKEYDGETRKFRTAVTEALDKREETARKAGDRKAVEAAKAERDRFDKNGELPASTPAAALTQMKAARANLARGYMAAVKDYVRLKEDAAAEATEMEYQKTACDAAFLFGKRTHVATLKALNVKVHDNLFKTTEKFKMGGEEVSHCIFMHPEAKGEGQASFALGGKATAFRAALGIPKYTNPQYNPAAPVTFEVLGDGKSLWKSEPVTKMDEFQTCTVNVEKVKTLTLRISAKDYGWAHAVWFAPLIAE